jgi:hypothetical protein
MLKLKKNNAASYDGIPVELWKIFCMRRNRIETLTNMFNKINNGKEFLMDWKIAITHPIYKGKGNREKPGNYRGISLLSICGKIFSGILAGRRRDWLVYHKGLSVFQAGFIKGKWTTANVFVIKPAIERYLRFKRRRLYWCFVDSEKAIYSTHR